MCPGFESLIRHHQIPMRLPSSLLLAASLLFSWDAALAQTRIIPADAKPGRLTVLQAPFVRMTDPAFHLSDLFGKSYVDLRLAPGARVFNARNVAVPVNHLSAETLVRYQVDLKGQVRAVWVLTEIEAAELDKPRPQLRPLPAAQP
ncbi:MAG: hypothetical protein RI936_416 [Pseudomonadota bacterium]